jgi:hypothetical protein
MRSLFLHYQNSLLTLKQLFSSILNYFLQDADVQNLFVGCIIILQIAAFVIKQGYLKAYLSILSIRHSDATVSFDGRGVLYVSFNQGTQDFELG